MRYSWNEVTWIAQGLLLYAAVLASYAAKSRLAFGWPPSAWIGAFAIVAILYALRSRHSLGGAQLTYRRRTAVYGHWFVLAFWGLFPLLHAFTSTAPYEASSVVVAALAHAAIDAEGVVAFGRRGVFIGRVRDWTEHHFEVREREGRLICRREPNVDRLAPIVASVPKDRIEEVAAILAEHQPGAEA